MSKQSQKYHLSLAGEFFVAAELQRRGISAAVTYGNAKKADVIALSGEKAVIIEVKSTSSPKWIVGGTIPEPSEKPWVFVFLPTESTEPPAYFILLQSELHSELTPLQEEYFRRFKEKHGVDYGDRPGVENLSIKQANKYRDNWSKIVDLLK